MYVSTITDVKPKMETTNVEVKRNFVIYHKKRNKNHKVK